MDHNLRSYKVWDLPLRLFHWINFAAMLGLIGIGLAILNADALGASTEGKILLKQTHVLVGYVFAINLLLRIVWGFVGGRHARWRTILPFSRSWRAQLKSWLAAKSAGRKQYFLGHNPLGRLSLLVLYTLLLTQAATGLFLAGSDLFWPPFGSMIAEQVAAPGVDPDSLRPYAKDMYDSVAWADMREIRKPLITIHVYGFYALLVMGLLHIAAVVREELHGSTLVSAMITGRKLLPDPPEDTTRTED